MSARRSRSDKYISRDGGRGALPHQGEKAEAHNLLSEVYNWFTEGFDTKDLQEAKALLEELS
jgi:predicted ATPase